MLSIAEQAIMKGVTAVCRMRNSFLRRRRRSTPQPLTGEPFKRQPPQSLPCKGRWMRRKAQTEGCIAALPHRYPANPGRALPRVRRGRCWHRPANPAMPPTPSGGRKRALTRRRQLTVMPDRGPMRSSAPTKGPGGGRCTPAALLPRQQPPPPVPPQNRKDPLCRKKKIAILLPAWPRH